MYAEEVLTPEDIISMPPATTSVPPRVPARGTLPPFLALGSNTEVAEPEPAPAPLGPSEAEHLAVYLRRMDAIVGMMCARIGLSREGLRAGAPPAKEATTDERFEVGELLHGLKRIEALVGPEDDGIIHPYADMEVLHALEVVEREIDPEELRLWLTPQAQEALLVDDIREALDRLVGLSKIQTRTVLLSGGATHKRHGKRVYYFGGCGTLHLVYASYRKI
jgi:hypothetical protein